jgi:hypothetical protein
MYGWHKIYPVAKYDYRGRRRLPHAGNTLRRPREYFYGEHQQRVTNAAIRRTASPEDDILLADDGPVNGGMGVFHHHVVR